MDNRPRLIALCGCGGAGKDTVADILVRRAGFARRIAFADALRAFVLKLDPFLPEAQMRYSALLAAEGGYEPAKRRHRCVRELLVRVGHGARMAIAPTVWLDAALPADGTRTAGQRAVVTDVRYANEAARVRALGGEVWRVRRPAVEPAHATEAASLAELEPDRTLENDGSLADLESAALALLAASFVQAQ